MPSRRISGPSLRAELKQRHHSQYSINRLLDELDIIEKKERNQLWCSLRSVFTDFGRKEVPLLDDLRLRSFARDFLEDKAGPSKDCPNGIKYFPPYYLRDHGFPVKKWTYDQHSEGITRIVTQILICIRDNVKHNMKRSLQKADKRARLKMRCPDPHRADSWVVPESDSETGTYI